MSITYQTTDSRQAKLLYYVITLKVIYNVILVVTQQPGLQVQQQTCDPKCKKKTQLLKQLVDYLISQFTTYCIKRKLFRYMINYVSFQVKDASLSIFAESVVQQNFTIGFNKLMNNTIN